jgi:general secretion pathway protein D
MNKRFVAVLVLAFISGSFLLHPAASVAVDLEGKSPTAASSLTNQDENAGLFLAQAQAGQPGTTQPAAPQAQPQLAAPSGPVQPPPPVPQPQQNARPPVQQTGAVSFNFDDADVYSLIQTIFGDVLRVNYLVDPRVKGRVTFRSVKPVAREDVLPLMEVILRLNGVGIVEDAGLYRIVPIGDLPKEPAPIGIGRNPEQVQVVGKALVHVVPIKYAVSTEMIRILTPFLSTNAVIVDVPKSNHIIIVDTDDNVKRLLQLIGIFDSDFLKHTKPQIYVYAVQNSKAKDVAALLQQIFLGAKPSAQGAKPPQSVVPRTPGQTGQTQTGFQPAATAQQQAAQPGQVNVAAPGAGGTTVLNEVTKIIPDETTNSIVIFAPPEDYELIAETIRKIDIAPRQVSIEGLIVDITLTDNLSFGLSWSMNSNAGNAGLAGAFFNNAGNLSSTPSATGFTFIGTDPTGNVRAVLTALQSKSLAKVVAAPHVIVSDNQQASIEIGQQIPLSTSQSSEVTATSGVAGTTAVSSTPIVATQTIQYQDIGIILKVKPQVNDSGLIALDLDQQISDISATSVPVGGVNTVAIDKTEAITNLVAQDGETIIIGGLIREDVSHGTTGIPFLSRIPIIGALFGSVTDQVTRKETIILLTPHVMRNPQDAQNVTSGYVKKYKGETKDKEVEKFVKQKGQTEGEGKAPEGGPEPQKNTP